MAANWQQYLTDPNAQERANAANFNRNQDAAEAAFNQRTDAMSTSPNFIGNPMDMRYNRAQYQGGPMKTNSMADIYEAQMKNLMYNPADITGMPGFQSGLEAIQRSLAAQGYMGSGNMMSEIGRYGGDFYNKQMQMLGGLRSQERQGDLGTSQLQMQGQQLGQQASQWGVEHQDKMKQEEEYRKYMEQFMQPQSTLNMGMGQPSPTSSPMMRAGGFGSGYDTSSF